MVQSNVAIGERPTQTTPWHQGAVTDDAHFDNFYESHRSELIRFAVRRNALDAEGVADLALFDGYRALDRMRSTDHRTIRSYLYKAARSHIAREFRHKAELPVELNEQLLDADPGFEDAYVNMLEIGNLVDQLPPAQRDVIRLRFLKDLTPAETARALGKNQNAIRQLQHRGLRHLRRLAFTAFALLIALGVTVIALITNGNRASVNSTPATPNMTETSLPTTSQPTTADFSTPPLSVVATTTPARSNSTQLFSPPDDSAVYEPFDLDGRDGAQIFDYAGTSSRGFAPDTVWGQPGDQATISFAHAGLTYVDSAGNELATQPGAIQVTPAGSSPTLTRPLAAPITGSETYWVSFLLRQDSPASGDAFWTPDGNFDYNGVGFQQSEFVRFVNGERSNHTISQGTTIFVVVRVGGDSSSLWINPSILKLGDPAATYANRWDADIRSAIFKFNSLNSGTYTIDEFRIASDYSAVAPAR